MKFGFVLFVVAHGIDITRGEREVLSYCLCGFDSFI